MREGPVLPKQPLIIQKLASGWSLFELPFQCFPQEAIEAFLVLPFDLCSQALQRYIRDRGESSPSACVFPNSSVNSTQSTEYTLEPHRFHPRTHDRPYFSKQNPTEDRGAQSSPQCAPCPVIKDIVCIHALEKAPGRHDVPGLVQNGSNQIPSRQRLEIIRLTHEQCYVPDIHFQIPIHLENDLGAPVRIRHDVGRVYLVEESAFSEVAKKWQSIARDNHLAGEDGATII